MRDSRECATPAATHDDCLRYLLVFGTFAQTPVFTGRDTVALARTQFLRAAVECRVEILTYCFIRDRVDLLIEEVGDAGGCAGFAARARRYSERAFRARWDGALWASGAQIRRLMDAEEAAARCRDILAGPVRAGLVARPGDYAFSGSFAWHRRRLLEPVPPAGRAVSHGRVARAPGTGGPGRGMLP